MNKTKAVITFFTLILAMAFIGCDNGNGAVNTNSAIKIEMVQIPAGSVTLNTTDPIFTVNLSAFKIGQYQVTQAQYEAVIGNNPSYFKTGIVTGEIQEKRPVEQVTWYDAIEFCNKLSELQGRIPVYSITGRTPASGYPITDASVTADFTKNGYRLPTEAQWEYACRAGSTGDYSKGAGGTEVTTTNLNNYAWYLLNIPTQTEGESGFGTQEVGKKIGNAFGLYDMHGNVWEWCWDWYGTYPSSIQKDYTGASTGPGRVIRGGGWNTSTMDQLSSSNRNNMEPAYWDFSLGFRLVCP